MCWRGYMAPEYALRGYLTDKADVFSFGVVALEIVAGKNNMKYQPNENFVCLLDKVKYIFLCSLKLVATGKLWSTNPGCFFCNYHIWPGQGGKQMVYNLVWSV